MRTYGSARSAGPISGRGRPVPTKPRLYKALPSRINRSPFPELEEARREEILQEKPPAYRGKKGQRVPQDVKDHAVELYRDNGWSITKISKQLGISPPVVSRALDDAGVTRR